MANMQLTQEEWDRIFGVEPKKPERTFGGTMQDIGVTLGNAALGAGESVVGLGNLLTGGLVGKGMNALGYDPKAAREYLSQYYSDAQKAANREVDEAKGFWDTTGAMLRNPSTIAATAVESAPSMYLGGGIGGKLLSAATGRLAKAAQAGSKSAAKYFERNAAGELLKDRTGQLMLSEAGRKALGRRYAAVGEGAIAGGALAEQMRQEDPNKEFQAKHALYGGLGGAITGGIGRLGSGVANRMGVTDVDTLLTTGLRGAAQEGGKRLTAGQIAKGIGAGALTEGVFEELPQSMQEEIWTNLAAGRPWNENIGKAGAQGMMAGFVMGAGANARAGMPGAQREILDAQTARERERIEALGRSLYSRPDDAPSTQAGLDAVQAARNAEAAAAAAGAQARQGYSGVIGKALSAADNGAPTSAADSAFASLPITLPTPGDSALEAQGDNLTRRQQVAEYLGGRRARPQPETDAQRMAREAQELELARNTPQVRDMIMRLEAKLAEARRTATTKEEIREAENNLRLAVEFSRPIWERNQQAQQDETLRRMDDMAAANQREEQLWETNLRQRLANLGTVVGRQAEQVRAEEQHAKDHNLVYTGDTSIPANALVRGDKVQVRDAQGRPDVATVRGSTDDGRIILQDGVRMTFGENDMVPIQGLSLNEHAGRQQQGWGFKTKEEREALRMQRAQRKAVDAIYREEGKRRRQEEAEQAAQAKRQAVEDQLQAVRDAYAADRAAQAEARRRYTGVPTQAARNAGAPSSEMDAALGFLPDDLPTPGDSAIEALDRTPRMRQAEAEHDAKMQQPAPPPKTETKKERQDREKAELEQALQVASPLWRDRIVAAQDKLADAKKTKDKDAIQAAENRLRAAVGNALKSAPETPTQEAPDHDQRERQYYGQQLSDVLQGRLGFARGRARNLTDVLRGRIDSMKAQAREAAPARRLARRKAKAEARAPYIEQEMRERGRQWQEREQQAQQAQQDAANEQTRQANRAAGRQWMEERAASGDLGPADGVTRANRAPTSEMESMFPFMPETEQAATPTQPAAKTESKTARAKREAEELKRAKAVSPQWNERLSKTQEALSEARKAGDQKAVQQLTGQLRAGVQNALKMQAERNARATAESQEQTRARMDRSHAEHEAQVAQYLREQGEHIRRQWIDLTRASVLPDFARNIGRNRVPAQARSQEAETTTSTAEVEDALNLFMLAAQSDEQRAQVSAVRDELARQPETAEEARWQRSMRERLATAGRRMRDEMRQREGRRLPAPQQGQSTPQTTRTRTQPQARQEAPKQIEYKPQPAYPGDAAVQQGQGFGFRPKAQRQAQALIPYMPQETREENTTAPAYPGRPQAPAMPRTKAEQNSNVEQNSTGSQNTKNAANVGPAPKTEDAGSRDAEAILFNVQGGFGFRNLANRQENAREERAESVSTREEAQGNTTEARQAQTKTALTPEEQGHIEFQIESEKKKTITAPDGTVYKVVNIKGNRNQIYNVLVKDPGMPFSNRTLEAPKYMSRFWTRAEATRAIITDINARLQKQAQTTEETAQTATPTQRQAPAEDFSRRRREANKKEADEEARKLREAENPARYFVDGLLGNEFKAVDLDGRTYSFVWQGSDVFLHVQEYGYDFGEYTEHQAKPHNGFGAERNTVNAALTALDMANVPNKERLLNEYREYLQIIAGKLNRATGPDGTTYSLKTTKSGEVSAVEITRSDGRTSTIKPEYVLGANWTRFEAAQMIFDRIRKNPINSRQAPAQDEFIQTLRDTGEVVNALGITYRLVELKSRPGAFKVVAEKDGKQVNVTNRGMSREDAANKAWEDSADVEASVDFDGFLRRQQEAERQKNLEQIRRDRAQRKLAESKEKQRRAEVGRQRKARIQAVKDRVESSRLPGFGFRPASQRQAQADEVKAAAQAIEQGFRERYGDAAWENHGKGRIIIGGLPETPTQTPAVKTEVPRQKPAATPEAQGAPQNDAMRSAEGKLNDAEIAALEKLGFKRWQKGNMDRMYINASALGLRWNEYKTGNISSATWQGEGISNHKATGIRDAKTYVDVATGEVRGNNDMALERAREMVAEARQSARVTPAAETAPTAPQGQATPPAQTGRDDEAIASAAPTRTDEIREDGRPARRADESRPWLGDSPVERAAATMTDAEGDAMLDSIFGPEEGKPEKPLKTRPLKERTQVSRAKTRAKKAVKKTEDKPLGQIAEEGGKAAIETVKEIFEGLDKLFTPKNTLGSGIIFTEESYQAAKPHFIAAWKNAIRLKYSIEEFFAGLLKRYGQPIAPFARRFWQDIRSGAINIYEEENNGPETKPGSAAATAAQEPLRQDDNRLETDRPGTLETVPAEMGELDERGDTGVRGAGSGQENAQGNQGTDAQGSTVPRGGRDGAGEVHHGQTGRGRGRGQRNVKPSAETADPNQTSSPTAIPAANFTITPDLELGKGGPVAKYNDNIAAIRTLKQIQAEGRRATPAEQAVLAKYVGWGGLADAFRNKQTGKVKEGWEKRVEELESLLTPEELETARNSTQNAHYTSQDVVNAIWHGMRRLGFQGGNVLEPSVGTGNFLGLMPKELAGTTRFTAAEFDGITAGIAKLLYPNENIRHTPFEKMPLLRGGMDAMVGNPPFGSTRLTFVNVAGINGFTIHNQFVLASLDALKPGGVMGFVVSHHLMDSQNTAVRKKIADQAKLLGAIRLPGTAFLENARTEVVTDIIFLQKKTKTEQKAWDETKAKDLIYPDWVETSAALGGVLGKDGKPLAPIWINNWFADHPERVLGVMNREGSMRQANELGVAYNGTDVAGNLKRMIDRMLPQNVVENDIAKAEQVYAEMVTHMDLTLAGRQPGDVHIDENGVLEQVYERGSAVGDEELVLTTRQLTPDSPWARDLTQTADGRWYEMVDVLDQNGKPLKAVNEKTGKNTNRNVKEKRYYEEEEISSGKRLGQTRYDRLKDAARLIDLVKAQVRMEASPKSTDEEIEAHRRKLARTYDEYVDTHGYVNDPKTDQLIGDMPNGPMLQALEKSYTKKTKDRPAQAERADILSKRVVFPYAAQTRAENGSDALGVSLSESGRVDVRRIAALLGTDERTAIAELFDNAEQPLIFYDPETQGWTSADDYLSGNVRRKLNAAMAARDAAQVANDTELAARLDKGIEALERVQPELWKADQITPVLGATWVPEDVYADFYNHLTGGRATVTHIPQIGQYIVTVHEPGGKVGAWSTEERDAGFLLNAALSSKSVRVNTKDEDEDSKTFDPEATAAAMDKIAEMREEFTNWAFQNAERRNRLVGVFNDMFNTRVNRQWDGSHLQMPGKVPDSIIKMRRHQMNAIWRGIVDRFVLYDHAVGAGKTFTGIARAMERKRMGLSRKPMIVVPNHLVNQFASDVYRLYPGAKVLAAGATDLERSKRRRMFGRIATGDWDIVIVPHSSFEFIGIDPSTEMMFTQEVLEEALQSKELLEDQEKGSFGKSPALKSVEALITRLQSRMTALQARGRNKDRLLTFEQMGVDDLTVDEAHLYKNLFYHSNVQASGMGTRSGSSRAYDMWTKVRILRESGGSVAFMTGTPISNSAVEMHILMRYLAENELEELGLEHFDSWRTQYVDISTAFEPTESGSGLKEVTRMGREWNNMRSLMDLYYSFADCVTNEDIQKWYFEDTGEEFPLPRVKGGGRQNVNVQPTPEQERILDGVIAGFDSLPGIKNPNERAAERLRLMNRARDVSLDAREVNPSAPAEQGGKINAVCDRVYALYTKYDAVQGTQLIFLDRSVPKAKGDAKRLKDYDEALAAYAQAEARGDDKAAQEAADKLEKFDAHEMEAIRKAQAGGWNAYQQIKDNLVAMGIPAEQIRFVQEANTDQQKQDLFDAVKRGDVRVLIGSTQRMGAGTNVQDRLVALHHVDVTWKPSDIEQREGRIIRQGNLLATEPTPDQPNPLYDPNFEVEILSYTTERTVDAKMWSLNSTKMRMINGIRKYDGSFNMEFDDTESLSMAEIAAEASGDPLQLERVQLDSEITTLERQKRGFLRNRYALEDSIAQTERDVAELPAEIAYFEEYGKVVDRGLAEESTWKNHTLKVTIDGETYAGAFRDAAIEHVRETAAKAKAAGEKFSVKIGGVEYTSVEKAENAIYAALGDASIFVGELNGQRFASQREIRLHVAELTAKADLYNQLPGVDVHIGTYKQGGLEFDLSAAKAPGSGNGITFYFAQKVPADAPQSYRSRRITLLYDGKFSPDHKTVDPNSYLKMFHKLTTKIVEVTPTKVEVLKHRLERARESLPALQEQRKSEWPKQKQLDEKKARLAEVERQLNEQAEAAERGVRLSVASSVAPGVPVENRADIEGELRAAIGKTRANKILRARNGHIRIIDTQEEAKALIGQDNETVKRAKDGTIQGFYLNGIAYLVRDGIAKGNVMGVLMHEYGEHAAQLGFADNVGYRAILKSLERRQNEDSETGRAIRAAMQRAKNAGLNENDRDFWSEVAAYLVEANANVKTSVLDRVTNFFKKWLFKVSGLGADNFTHKDLVMFARAAVKAAGRTGAKATTDRATRDMLASFAKAMGVSPEQLQAEYEATEKRYAKELAAGRKAPNGKKSNLSKRQWILVRTPRFKKWFGDWELAGQREFLLNGKPVVSIPSERIVANPGQTFVQAVTEMFASQGGKASSPFGEVLLDKKGVKNDVNHGVGPIKNIAFRSVKDVLESGIVILPLEQHFVHGKKQETGIIAAPIDIGGEKYVCLVEVIANKTDNRLYVHEVFATKNLRKGVVSKQVRDGNAASPDPSGEIAELLRKIVTVKDSSRVVDENGEPLVVYHGTTRGGFSVFKANAEDRGFWFYDNRESAETYTGTGTPDVREFHNIPETPDGLLGFFKERMLARGLSEADAETNARLISDDIINRWKQRDDGKWEEVLEDDGSSDFFAEPATPRVVNSFHDVVKESNASLGGPGIYPVFLNILNISEIKHLRHFREDDGTKTDDYVKAAFKAGHDGVVFRNINDDGGRGGIRAIGDVYVVKHSTQIKSATDNTGAFDPDNPDIRFSIAASSPAAPAANPAANNTVTGQSFVDRILDHADPKWRDRWERFIYNFIDNNDPRERVWKKAGAPTDQDFVTVERLRGKKAAAEQKKFREEMVTPMLQTLGKGGLAVSDLEEYAHAMHTPERNQKMREVNAKRNLDALRRHMPKAEAQNLQDQIDFVRTVGKANGWTQSDIQNAYLGMMENVFQDIPRREALAAQARARLTPTSSRNAIAHVEKLERDLAETKAIRDRWRRESIRFAGQTDQEAQATIQKWQRDSRFAALQRAHNQLEDITAATLDVLHEAGYLSDEEFQEIKNGYQHYVPLHRDGFLDTTPIKLMQVAKGSMRDVVHIVSNVVRSHETAVNRKHRAAAGKALYEFAEAFPDAGISIEEMEMKPTHDQEGNIVMYRSQAEPEDGIFVRVNGKQYLLRFAASNKTPEGRTLLRFLESVKGSDAQLGGMTKALHWVTSKLAMVNTSLSPEFMVTNFARDLQTAFIHLNQKDIDMDGLKTAVAHDIFPAMKGIWAAERGDKTSSMAKWYADFQANGGKVGWMQGYEEAEKLTEDLQEEMKLYQDGHHTLKARKKLMKLVESGNAAIENCMRLATYKNLVERGISKDKAARIASGLTVDFTQHGKMGPQINALYMFWNASVQGSVRMVQALASSKKVRAIAGGIAGAGFVLQMLALAGGGDDDSGEPYILGIPDAIRERNIIIMLPGGEGKYIKIPKAYGYGAIYDFGAELANSIYMGAQGRKYDHTKGAMRVITSFANSFNPIQSATMLQTLAPTLLDPVAYVAENRTWADTPLMPEQNPYGPPKPDSERFWKGTSPVWKKTVAAINDLTGGDKYQSGWADVSPETLSMIWDNATGGMGRFIGNTLSLPFTIATGDTEAHKVPFARQVFGTWNDRAISSRYYEAMDRAEIAHMRFKNAENLAERKRLYQTPDHKLYLKTRQTEKQIRALRKRQQAMEAAGNRDGAERIRTRIVAAQSKVLAAMQ